jgi:hypothetical protein
LSSPEGTGAEEGYWLQLAARIAGLLAGFVALVYVTGGVVMALRLAFKNLPWDNVVSQLPREFLISIGLGQVLIPALLVGGLYGFFRLLRTDRAKPPELHRLRDAGARRGAVGGYARTLAVLSIPPALIFIRGAWRGDLGLEVLPVIALTVILLAAVAGVVHETRAIILARERSIHRWNSLRTVVAVAALYAAATIPSMMIAAAGLPLTEAKVCTTNNSTESGYFVGQTSDRVYLGEKGKARRIAVIPMAQVEELFIGSDADGALCEYVSAPPSALERHELEHTYRSGDPRMHSLLTPEG